MNGERLDSVEIKVTIGPSAMAQAMEALGLDPAAGDRRRIWFCDAAAPGPDGPVPVLLGQGVILRLRAKDGKGADSTVKVRPFQPPLAARWRDVGVGDDDAVDLEVQGDWVLGADPVVAASLTVDQGGDEPAEAAAGRRPLSRLFSQLQEDFLADHAPAPVDLDALRALGPITAVKWEPADRGLPHDLAAEHWKVDDLEFLELSVLAERPKDAPDVQHRFERALRERSVKIGGKQATKTRTVLDHLVRRA